MNHFKKVFVLLMLFGLFNACAGDPIFLPISTVTSNLQLSAPIAMVVNPVNNRAYLVSANNTVLYNDGSLVILDLTNPTAPIVVDIVSLPSFSGQIVLDATRNYLFIPNRLSSDKTDVVDQVLRVDINEASATFLAVDYFTSGNNPFGIAYDGTDALFVAANDAVFRYDADDLSGYTKVPTNFTKSDGDTVDGTFTRELLIGPLGDNLYVSNRADQLMILNIPSFTAPTAGSFTDLDTSVVDYVISDMDSTRGLARDTTNNDVYVVEGSPPVLKILDDAALTANGGAAQEISAGTLLIGTVPLGTDPSEVVLDITNSRAYVSNTGSNDISVIDTDLLAEIARIELDENLPAGMDVGKQPFGLVVASISGTTYLYVTNLETHNVSIINTSTLAIVGNIP